MNRKDIAKIIYEELCYMYCDNCRYNSEVGEDDPNFGCDDCHRKYNGWGVSMAEAERIAEMIGGDTKEALKQPSDEMQLLNDGTLKVKVANVLNIKRVMVMDANVIYDSYYPDRPKGEWIVSENGRYITCSNCGLKMFHSDWAYCPICGADMRCENNAD